MEGRAAYSKIRIYYGGVTMKMRRNEVFKLLSVGFLCVLALVLTANSVYAGEGINDYAHISYVDKNATVIRSDGTEHNAVVNLPVVAGDTVVTGGKDRCELQFDNGSIIRLDKNTRLKVTTILAPSLTSRWKITTLHLLSGSIYTMVQSYNREMFQIITPNAAMDMNRRTIADIQARESGETYIRSSKGKFDIMFGPNKDALDVQRIKPGKAFSITPFHKVKPAGDERNVEFTGWNKYVTRNFKDLHHGVSNVPKKLYRSNKALVYWAEKFSTVYGEWVYDDLFGYVWKPADEMFTLSKRPFFNAQIVKVNNETMVVPTEPWGWVPAHMGTWVWTKSGWTWIPGTAFTTGLASLQFVTFFPTMDYWMRYLYGGFDGYYYYRKNGYRSWQVKYGHLIDKKVNQKPGLKLKKLPKPVRTLIKKLNNAPVSVLKERLGTNRPMPTFDANRIKHIMKSGKPVDRRIVPSRAKTPVTGKRAKVNPSKTIVGNALKSELSSTQENPVVKNLLADNGLRRGIARGGAVKSVNNRFRDWNPDIHWGINKGVTVKYNSRNNEVVVPKMKLSSRMITNAERAKLTNGRSRNSRGYVKGRTVVSNSSSSGSGGSSSGRTTKTTVTSTSSRYSASSNRGGGGKEKQ